MSFWKPTTGADLRRQNHVVGSVVVATASLLPFVIPALAWLLLGVRTPWVLAAGAGVTLPLVLIVNVIYGRIHQAHLRRIYPIPAREERP